MSPVAHSALSGLGVGVAGQPACLTGPDDGRRAPPLGVEPPRRPEIASRLEGPSRAQDLQLLANMAKGTELDLLFAFSNACRAKLDHG